MITKKLSILFVFAILLLVISSVSVSADDTYAFAWTDVSFLGVTDNINSGFYVGVSDKFYSTTQGYHLSSGFLDTSYSNKISVNEDSSFKNCESTTGISGINGEGCVRDTSGQNAVLQYSFGNSSSYDVFEGMDINDYFDVDSDFDDLSDHYALIDTNSHSEGAIIGQYVYYLGTQGDTYTVKFRPSIDITQRKNNLADEEKFSDAFLTAYICSVNKTDNIFDDCNVLFSSNLAFASRKNNHINSEDHFSYDFGISEKNIEPGAYAVFFVMEFQADSSSSHTGAKFTFQDADFPINSPYLIENFALKHKNICEDYGYHWLPSAESELGEDGDYYCCGYDYNTDGTAYSRGGYVCNMSSHEWESEAEYCSAQSGSESAFCHNTDIQKSSDDVNKGMEEIQDGSDGCCGDDANLISLNGGDLGYVGTSSSTGDQQYLCANDSFYGLVDSSLSDEYQYTLWNNLVYSDYTPAWRWWDAQEGPNSFIIHSVAGVDYIANGQEWFYCNATGANRPTGIAIADGENFSFSTTANEGFPCTNPLNALAPLFAEDGVCQDVLADDVNFFFETNSSANFYCDSQATFSFESNDEGFKTVCYEGDQEYNCKAKKSVLDADDEGHFNSISDFVNNIDDSSCKANITRELCVALNGDSIFCDTSSLDSSDAETDETTDFQEKSFCGDNLENCLMESGSYEGSCSDIDFERDEISYTGHLVDSSHYCLSGDYAQTSETLGGDKVCCVAQDSITDPEYISAPLPLLEEGEELDEETCHSILGDYIPADTTSSYICSGSIVGQTCCLANSGWQPNFQALALGDLTLPEAFICYSHSGQARISECCTDYTTCNNNLDVSLFSESGNQNNLGFYGKGGTLHTLKNFDTFEDGVLKDMVAIQSKDDDGIFYFTFSPKNKLIYEQQTNIETFDYLEFDIAFNTKDFASYTSVYLVDNNDNNCSLGKLSKSLLNGQSQMRWHHAVFELPQSCPSNFDMSLIKAVKFKTSENGHATIAVDNFFVSEDDSDLTTNTPTHYCTGNFGSWISNLDGETDKGWFDEDFSNELIDKTGEYWYACEAQASFDWTGRACCGDDTYIPFKTAGNQLGGEYWADAKGGCFHGNPVMDDEVVGERLNEENYDNLLFFDGEYLLCGNEDYDLKQSFDGKTFNQDNSLVQTTVDPLVVKGTHICSDHGAWIPVEDYPVATIMLSSLYNLTIASQDDGVVERYSFDLVCEDVQNFIPEEIYLHEQSHLEDLTSENITTFCTLTLYDENDDVSSLVALSHSSDYTASEFLSSIKQHLLFASQDLTGFTSNNDDQDITTWCNSVEQSTTTPQTFYQVCDDFETTSSLDVRLSYNPDFNILLIAQELTSDNDFNGIFATKTGFFNALWQDFKDLLNQWFTSSSGLHDTGVFDAQTTLPITINDADFDVFAMRSRGQKQIIAVQEGVQQSTDNLKQLVVEYRNFPSIKKTLEPFIGAGVPSDFIARPFITGNENTQQFSILFKERVSNPDDGAVAAQNVYGEYMTFWPDFNWKDIVLLPDFTSKEDEDYSNLFDSTPNNGVLELGEYCEQIEDDVIYRYNNQSCEFWNATHPYGTVSCNFSSSQLNHDSCSNVPPLDIDDDVFSSDNDSSNTGALQTRV
ncbi:MAG: hypothetical protein ACLFNM_00270 [Candidatus Woesearchaeota archaeon]